MSTAAVATGRSGRPAAAASPSRAARARRGDGALGEPGEQRPDPGQGERPGDEHEHGQGGEQRVVGAAGRDPDPAPGDEQEGHRDAAERAGLDRTPHPGAGAPAGAGRNGERQGQQDGGPGREREHDRQRRDDARDRDACGVQPGRGGDRGGRRGAREQAEQRPAGGREGDLAREQRAQDPTTRAAAAQRPDERLVVTAQRRTADDGRAEQEHGGRAAEHGEAAGRRARPGVLRAQHVVHGREDEAGPGDPQVVGDLGGLGDPGVDALRAHLVEVERCDPADRALPQRQGLQQRDPLDAVPEQDGRVRPRVERAGQQERVGAPGVTDDPQAELGRQERVTARVGERDDLAEGRGAGGGQPAVDEPDGGRQVVRRGEHVVAAAAVAERPEDQLAVQRPPREPGQRAAHGGVERGELRGVRRGVERHDDAALAGRAGGEPALERGVRRRGGQGGREDGQHRGDREPGGDEEPTAAGVPDAGAEQPGDDPDRPRHRRHLPVPDQSLPRRTDGPGP